MDILKENIKSIYFKYLLAAFGGTLIGKAYRLLRDFGICVSHNDGSIYDRVFEQAAQQEQEGFYV